MTLAEDDTQPGTVSRNPATGALIGTYPYHSPDALEQILTAHAVATKIWRTASMPLRTGCFRRLAATLLERQDMLARLATAEMGKTLQASREEVEKCARTLEWFADHGPTYLADEFADIGADGRAYVSFLPIGSVLGVMPWNFPFWQVIRAAAPLMLAGNGFILKHAANVTGCGQALTAAFDASGFPPGVFAHVNLDRHATLALIDDPRVAAVTLTGSAGAGAAVASAAGRAIKKSLLELGGSDPFIVLADADLDRAVAAGIQARYQNAGQVCLAAKRFILERPIAEAFTAKFVAAAARVRAGDPLEPSSTIGPLARHDLRDELHGQVQRSIAAGAELLLGGHPLEGPGAFYAPTVLANVRPGMAAFDEEVFGPVAALTVAQDADDAIALANASDFGLAGAIWTADLGTAAQLARRLESGGCFVNGFTATDARVPVGGVKKSGYGRELSHFGLREFTNAQTVWISTPPSSFAPAVQTGLDTAEIDLTPVW